MVSELIIKSFLLAGVIGFLAIGFFMLLNARSSKVDQRTYDDDFDPGKLVSPYKIDEGGEQHEVSADKDGVQMHYGKKEDSSTSEQTEEKEVPDTPQKEPSTKDSPEAEETANTPGEEDDTEKE